VYSRTPPPLQAQPLPPYSSADPGANLKLTEIDTDPAQVAFTSGDRQALDCGRLMFSAGERGPPSPDRHPAPIDAGPDRRHSERCGHGSAKAGGAASALQAVIPAIECLDSSLDFQRGSLFPPVVATKFCVPGRSETRRVEHRPGIAWVQVSSAVRHMF